jgi:hypothetical protein
MRWEGVLSAVLVSFVVCVPACEWHSVPSNVDGSGCDAYMRLREAARKTVAADCGECHTGGSPTTLPKALAVFDVTEQDWTSRMTDRQLHDVEFRLEGGLAPTRGPEEARRFAYTTEERNSVKAFVAAEMARRQERARESASTGAAASTLPTASPMTPPAPASTQPSPPVSPATVEAAATN